MYCSAQDLLDRFGERELIDLTDRSGSGAINEIVVDLAIADASAQIDAYLAGRYSLPIAHVPAVLVRVAADLVRYQLYGDQCPEPIRQRQQDALKFLDAIASGKVQLGLSTTGDAVPTGGDVAEFSSGGVLWARDSSKGFI